MARDRPRDDRVRPRTVLGIGRPRDRYKVITELGLRGLTSIKREVIYRNSFDGAVDAKVHDLTLTTYPVSTGVVTEVLANVDTLTSTTYQVSIGYSTQANVDALTLTTYQASIEKPTIVYAVTDALSVTTYDVGLNEDANTWFNENWWVSPFWSNTWWVDGTGESNVQPAVVPLTLSTHPTSIVNLTEIVAVEDTLTVTTYQASTQDHEAAAITDVLSLTTYDALIEKAIEVSANIDTLSLTTYSITQGVQTDVFANVDALTVTTYDVNINVPESILANVDALSLTTYDVSIVNLTEIVANVDTLTLTDYNSDILVDINITPTPDTLSVSTYTVDVRPATIHIQFNNDYTYTGGQETTGIKFTKNHVADQKSTDEFFATLCNAGNWICGGTATIVSGSATLATNGDTFTQTMSETIVSGTEYTVTINSDLSGGGSVNISLGGGSAVNHAVDGVETEVLVTAGAANQNLVVTAAASVNDAVLSRLKVDLVTGISVSPTSGTDIGNNVMRYAVDFGAAYHPIVHSDLVTFEYTYPTGSYAADPSGTPMQTNSLVIEVCT